jgi:hypothetical protein
MRLIGFVLLLLLLGQTGGPPAPIHTVYDDYWKSTEIKTNWLYVINAPDQFLQLKLVGRFDGKTMPKTGPGVLEIQVISHAPKHKYVAPPELVAIADGVELRIGKMEEHIDQFLTGMFKGGKKEGQSMANTVSPVPATAAVLGQHKIDDLAAEWIVTSVSWEQLTTMAKASKIDWRLGDTAFSFIEVQVTRLKQFVAAVTPESGVVVVNKPGEERVDKPARTDTPSDANNSTLKDTLDWLKKQIGKYAADSSVTSAPESLTLTKFSSCNIEWRLAPPVTLEAPGSRSNSQSYLPPTMYYAVNLKDLEPGSVEMTKSENRFWLGFAARDREQLIKLTYKDTRTGADQYKDPRLLDHASIALKKNDLSGELREALSHAIKLCQASPTK